MVSACRETAPSVLHPGVNVAGRYAREYPGHRVRPEEGLKKRNRIPDFECIDSVSYHRNRIFKKVSPVPVRPEPEFGILVPDPVIPDSEEKPDFQPKKIVFRLIFRIQPEFCHANPVLIDRNRNFEISIPVLNNRNRIFQSAFRFRFTGNGIPVPFRFPAG